MIAFFNLGLVVASTAISWAVTKACIAQALRRDLLDHPNERSSHSQPVPRVGGIGIALGFLAPFFAVALASGRGDHWAAIGLGMAGAAVIGLWDDFRSLVPLRKYVLQFAIAGLLITSGLVVREISLPLLGTIALGWLAIPLSLIWLTGFPNFFNFMDGINGMAGGTGAIYGAFLAAFAYMEGRADLAPVGLLMAGSSLGFLPHNFPRARTFMGDTGSLFLGLGMAMLVVLLAPGGLLPLLILCSVYLYDCVTTIFMRLASGENIFQAHRAHHYQRLVRGGWSHTQVACLYFAMHAAAGTLGLIYLRGGEARRLAVVIADLVMLAGLSALVYFVERRQKLGETQRNALRAVAGR